MRVPALVVALLLALPVAAWAQSRSLETTLLVTGVVDGDGVIHYDGRAFERFDLLSSADEILYRRPRSTRFDVAAWDAGAGRIGAQLESPRRTSGLIVDTNTGEITHIPGGRVEDRRGCGTSVKLEDVSESGEVLLTKAHVRCGRRTGTLTVTAYGPGTARVLHSRRVTHAWLRPDYPYRKLAGNHFLTVGERSVRVRDLATGQVRRFRTRARYASLYAEVGPDGRVLLDEFSRRRPEGIPRQVVRLAGPTGSGRDGVVVHDSHNPSRRLYATPRFCGTHPVSFAMTPRGRYELRVLDTGTVLATGRIWDPDYVDASCDAGSMVVISSPDGELSRIDIHPLPR